MGSHQPIRKVVTPEIPDKLYFRIGDVARICEVPAYVLRFWETEFPQLKPHKGGTGQRLYRKRDVEMALRIKSLLYDQGYTISGARQVFKGEGRVRDVSPVPAEEQAAPSRALPEPPQTKALPAPSASASISPSAADQDLRSLRLRALREDMLALCAALSAPVGTVPAPMGTASLAAARLPPAGPRLQALRPRLVSAPTDPASLRAATRPVVRSGLFSRPLPNDDQADLFPPAPAPFE